MSFTYINHCATSDNMLLKNINHCATNDNMTSIFINHYAARDDKSFTQILLCLSSTYDRYFDKINNISKYIFHCAITCHLHILTIEVQVFTNYNTAHI